MNIGLGARPRLYLLDLLYYLIYGSGRVFVRLPMFDILLSIVFVVI